MKNVVISIINYNGKENTLECLRSIDAVSSSEYKIQVLVIDNNSKEELIVPSDFLKNHSLDVIYNKANVGFSGGHNIAMKKVLEQGEQYILVLNNDTIVDKNLITELIDAAGTNPKAGIIAPKIYFAKGSEYHKNRYKESEKGNVLWYAGGRMDWDNVLGQHRGVDEVDKGQYDDVSETDFASGCCMLVKTEVIKKIGLFDERYFLYYEDNDFQERAKKAGFTILYAPKAILWHKNAGSAGGSGSGLQDYFITRNRLLFGISYASLRAKTALIKESLKLLITGRPMQKRGVIDFYRRRFGKGSYFNE